MGRQVLSYAVENLQAYLPSLASLTGESYQYLGPVALRQQSCQQDPMKKKLRYASRREVWFLGVSGTGDPQYSQVLADTRILW